LTEPGAAAYARAVPKRLLAVAVLATLLAGAAGCAAGPKASALRVTLTESGGDLQFTLSEPIRAVTCYERDHRRDPGAPGAAYVIWAARCTAGDDCLPSVTYGDRELSTTTAARRLAPSAPGTCYECLVEGTTGRGLVRFRTSARGGFEPCTARAGEL
jgi:hypothetical protein